MAPRSSVPQTERSLAMVFGNVVRLPLPDSDAALVACLRNDPAHGQMVLFDRYAADVERVLCRLLGADPELTDLLHDVFIDAMSAIGSLRDDSALRSWLIGIAVHKARRLIRHRKVRRIVRLVAPFELLDHAVPEPNHEASDALEQTYRLLARLPTDDRIAFTLRQIDGMPLSAIAEAVGASLATVKRRIARAQRTFVALAQQNDALAEWLEQGTLE